MAAIFGKKKNFWKLGRGLRRGTLWVKNFDEIALSRTVKEIQAILSFKIFVKNSKIQNGRHFWKEEKFFNIGQRTTQGVKNFDEIALSRTVKEI